MVRFMASLARALCLIFCVAIGTVVLAQSTAPGPDYAAWDTTASRAEAMVELDRASVTSLESLRGQVASFRQTFLEAQSTNATRISTLRTQIAALGDPPAEGATEDPDIATRRADLNAQLDQLLSPVRAAEEAFTRANGIITEIDQVIRERQTDALLTIGPSPLNPANWGPALAALTASGAGIVSEIQRGLASDAQREEMRQNAPLILLYLAIAFALVLRGRMWMGRLVSYFFSHTGRGAELWATLVSLGSIVVPMIGIYALTEALFATTLFGARGAVLLDNVPFWGLVILSARWLADRVFNRDAGLALFDISPVQRAEARTYVTVLAVLYVLRDALAGIAEYDRYSDATVAVLQAPLLLLTALILFRSGMLLISAVRPTVDENSEEVEDERTLRSRIMRVAGQGVLAVSIVGPILALIGYNAAAEGLVYPTVLTLGLMALLMVVQSVVRMTFRFVSGATEGEGLASVLVNFGLAVAIVPALALIWGARVADLTELWARFRAGFQVGDTRISPTDFLVFALVFAIGYTITRLAQGALRTSVLPRTRIDPGGQTAIISGLGYLGIFIAAIMAITTAGIDLSSLALVAGALSVGIGFGMQNIVSNFISGIILLIERPIAEGDWIEAGGYMGIVKDISVRSTRIETFDRTDVIVPNADLISSSVINWTRGSHVGRVLVPVGVAYGTDTRRVESILLEIARDHPLVLLNPEPAVDFLGFGADALDFRIRAIIRDINKLMVVKNEMNHAIAKRFGEEGIEIPFAQRDIWIRNPQDLTGSAGSAAQPDPEDEGAVVPGDSAPKGEGA